MQPTQAITQGVHHVGLTVSRLEDSARFFTDLLGWQEVRRDQDYPAIFVSDGTLMLTLWQSQTSPAIAFDKNSNIGLHHLALKVPSKQSLMDCFELMQREGITIEFPPEYLRQGPAMHMMCYEPSGIRIEFIWPGE